MYYIIGYKIILLIVNNNNNNNNNKAARAIFHSGDSFQGSDSMLVAIGILFPFLRPVFETLLPTPPRRKEFFGAFHTVESTSAAILKKRKEQRLESEGTEK